MLDIKHLQEMSDSRLQRWHTDPDDQWNALEWAGAMCGEAGEAANVAKKLRRLQGKIKNLDKRKTIGLKDYTHPEMEDQAMDYRAELAKEVADTILYGMCLFAHLKIDGESVIRQVFNQKSEEYGFPERV